MKVLHTLWAADFGGIERFAIDLAGAQTSMGIEPTFLFGTFTGRFVPDFRATDIPILSAGLKSGWVLSRSARSRVAKWMSEFDAINFHTFNPLIASAGVKSGRPLVFTDHGNYGHGRLWTWRDRVKRCLQRRFARHVDHFTFNSEYTQTLAFAAFDLDPKICTVVPNGIVHDSRAVDMSGLPPELLERVSGKFVVGTSSRLAGFKRVHLLIDAFAEFQKNWDNVALLIVGDGALRADLEARVDGLGIGQNVIFTGYQRNVRAYQNLMNACVFPSMGEPFGLVAIEALALGKATVVMADGGGIADIVRRVEPENVVQGVGELSTRLGELYADEQRADPEPTSERREARIAYAKTFDIHSTAVAMKRVYESVLRA